MNISKMASTVILATTLATIFLFVIIFYLYGGGSDALKDALSMTASFFGGITTLAAAYIAYYLYDDWRKPHNLSIETEHKKEILKIIRKIIPIEHKYDRLISNHFIYRDQSDRTIPIELNQHELNEFVNNINELFGLLNELYFITKDENINNLTSKYFNYAQLYHFILSRSESFYKSENKADLVNFLGTKLEFDFIDIDSKKWTTHTLYAYAFTGLEKVQLRKYISENLKLQEN